MIERLYHLNCGTLYPASAQFLDPGGRLLSLGYAVCHCLLLETESGLVLVDTGLGLQDVAAPRQLGRLFLALARPALDPAETAVRQVSALGFQASDVRHIVLTHLDLDHTGGLADFPRARVHVASVEYRTAMVARGQRARRRYVSAHWAHEPQWIQHQFVGERWFGFECAPISINGFGDLRMISLPGHSRGHCGVALQLSRGWLLFCGDAYHAQNEMKASAGRLSLQRAAHWVLHDDRVQVMRTRSLLEQLTREHPGEVTQFCAHDPDEFALLTHT